MTDMDNQLINDEEFARQLQQKEFNDALPTYNYFSKTNQNSNNHEINEPLLDNINNSNNNNNNDSINNNNNNNNDINIDIPNDSFNDNNINDELNNNVDGNENVRRNVINSVRNDFDSAKLVLFRCIFALIEIIATSTVLGIGWNEGTNNTECNRLKWWILAYSSRNLIQIPLRIYIYRLSRMNNNGINNNLRTEKPLQILRWIRLLQFLWFLVGQSFLFTSNGCSNDSPTIWYYCLVIIILVYVSLALPFLVVLAICICLPCVLIILRFFAEPEGADNTLIQKLPTRTITENDINEWNKLDNGNDNDNKPSCAICMCDYSVDDQLRKLPCNHEFHSECVDRWLPMKKICPLCRHDITKPIINKKNKKNNHE